MKVVSIKQIKKGVITMATLKFTWEMARKTFDTLAKRVPVSHLPELYGKRLAVRRRGDTVSFYFQELPTEGVIGWVGGINARMYYGADGKRLTIGYSVDDLYKRVNLWIQQQTKKSQSQPIKRGKTTNERNLKMKNTYWGGKKTDALEMLEAKKVGIGYTGNKVYNAYIAGTKIYYDMYNNGGFNIGENLQREDNYLKRLVEVILTAGVGEKFGKIRLTNKLDTIYNKLKETGEEGYYVNLEQFMDELIEEVVKHDLTIEVYKVWQDYQGRKVSLTQKDGEEWREVSFGQEDDYNSWVEHRTNVFGFELV